MNHRRHLTNFLLLSASTGLVGCSSTSRIFPLAAKPAATAPSSITPDPKSPNTTNDVIKRASFNDITAGDVTKAIDLETEELEASDSTQSSSVQPYTQPETSLSGTSLQDFETLAMSNNPTLRELIATTQKAEGFRNQVGLQANPTVGYQATQLADQGTDQHVAFISQTIVTGDKLQLNRRVLSETLRAQLLEVDAQRYRVTTDVRVKFYEALAAQKRLELMSDFQEVADKGLELAELRKKALEGSQLEVVQAMVQKNGIDLLVRRSTIRFQAAWRELVALVGSPELPVATLVGELPQQEAAVDWNEIAVSMVTSSPEYQAAQARVCQARANLDRQCIQPIPNLDLQFAAGHDNGTDSGMLNLQVGAPLPIFNKNQGNIAAARAELTRASQEVQRVENGIKVRLAAVSGDYDSALAAVDQYRSGILPNAARGLELAELAYQSGETSFVQVLVARRTYFDTNLDYIAAQTELATARAQVEGYVLSGALDAIVDESGDDSLRGLTLGQQ